MKAKRLPPAKPYIKLATEIMGTKIKTPEGDEVGVVQNLMIDPQHGSIIFMILCYANFMGRVHRLFAIPHHMLTVKSSVNGSLFLEIERRQLMNAHTKSSNEDSQPIYEILPDESQHAKAKKVMNAAV